MFPSSCCPIVALGGSAAARFGAILLMQFLRRRKRWVRPYRHGGKSSTGREPVLWSDPNPLYGFEIVADPFSVKSDFSSANWALARSIELPVVSTQPDPRFSPVSTLPANIISSCCCRLACSCLHQATKRPGAVDALLPLMRPSAPCSSFPARLRADPSSARRGERTELCRAIVVFSSSLLLLQVFPLKNELAKSEFVDQTQPLNPEKVFLLVTLIRPRQNRGVALSSKAPVTLGRVWLPNHCQRLARSTTPVSRQPSERKRLNGRSVNYITVSCEDGPMAGAVPGSVSIVPRHDAAFMRAKRRDSMRSTVITLPYRDLAAAKFITAPLPSSMSSRL